MMATKRTQERREPFGTAEYRLPRISKEHLPYTLRNAADKIERGEPLLIGETEPGVRMIEGHIVAAVLRAVADGKSPIRALAGNGPAPKGHAEVLRRVLEERRKVGIDVKGSLTLALKSIARQDRKSLDAVKKQYSRAKRQERDWWRHGFLSGSWPKFSHWRMSDSEIEEDARNCGPSFEDEVNYLRASRDSELAFIRKVTGWKTLPKWGGDKSPP